MNVVINGKKLRMKKLDLKVNQTDHVYFEHERDNGWLIRRKEGSKFVFSINNTWTTDLSKVRYFDLLHFAVNLAKRRCFRFEIPEYSYEISNDSMHIYYEGNEIGHVSIEFLEIFS